MMTKKLLYKLIVLVLILVVILSYTQICFADNFSMNFDRTIKNDNVKNVTLGNDNQNSTLNSLYNSGYRSVVSRYSQKLIHVTYNFFGNGIQLGVFYNYSNGNFSQFSDYINNNVVLSVVNAIGNNLNASNIDYSRLTMDKLILNQGANYAIRFDIKGYLEFDMPLTNLQLIDSNNASQLFYSMLLINLGNTKFQVGNGVYNVYRTELQIVNRFDYIVKYTLSEPLLNVDYVYLFNEISTYSTDSNFNNTYDYGTHNFTAYYNGISTRYEVDGVLSRCSLLYQLLDDSKFLSVDYGFNYSPYSNYQGYDYTFNDDFELYISIATFTPLFANNNSNFIQSDSNGNLTPIKLQYYDAQWYELHYQIANAFIFMITEFPILSDITNLIYSLFVMIKSSFEVLLNFDGFGIIFGVGMFAIVFGFILKYLIGE